MVILKKKKKEFNFADLTCFSIIKICWIKSTDAMVLCDVKVCFIGKIKDHIIYKLALLIGKYFWCIMVVNELLIIY
jgi:methyl coenzyme M reductase subunit C